MSGYLPPPPAPGQIGWASQQPQPVTPAGLVISPGAGLYARTQPGKLLLDGMSPTPGGDFCGFIPGNLAAAANRYHFRNAFPSGRAIVQVVEANLGTAPAGSSAANYFGLQVAGSNSGTLTVPMQPDGKYFVTDNGTPTKSIASNTATPATVGGGNGVYKGAAVPFAPTATYTAETLGFWFGNNPTNALQDGLHGGYFDLLDANLLPLASAQVPSNLQAGWYDAQLSSQVTLTQGQTYFAAVRSPSLTDAQAQPGQAMILLVDDSGYLPVVGMNKVGAGALPAGQSWVIQTGEANDFSNAKLTAYGVYPIFRIGTVPNGVAMAGDLLVSVTLTGAAPATPGADLGFRISMTQG